MAKQIHYSHKRGFKEMPKICEHGELAWAPHAISHYDTCFLFYSPLEIKLEISVDMQIWENWDDSINHPQYTLKFRDPMVLKIEDNKWIMYATALRHLDGNNSYGGVAKYISNDLRTWKFSGYALEMIDDAKSPEWSNVESPFVAKYGDYYYLSFTFTDSDISTYHKTLVFRSDNPYDFGKYDGHKLANNQCDLVTVIGAHAPEFVYDDLSDKWYITTCGWE
jgi:sucrose-6-phosphate hydrolase SacC (GH32 family)